MDNKIVAILVLGVICVLCIYFRVEGGVVMSIVTAIAGLSDGIPKLKKGASEKG